jgi:hypothetical protein
VVGSLAACGGGGAKSSGTTTPDKPAEVGDQIPTTKGPECAVVAEHLAQVAFADNVDGQAGAKEKFKTRCTQDQWADDARSCFATVETDDEIDGCKSKLTDAQRGKLGDSPAAAATPASAPETMAAPAGGTAKKKTRSTRSADPEEGGE